MSEENWVPDFKVRVGGQELAAEDRSHMQLISVDLRRQAPASVEIQLNNHAGEYDGRAELGAGAPVTVELGYTTQGLTKVFEGEVVGTQVRAKQNGPRSFVIRAFDYAHRLTRGRKTRTFLDQKFSDVVTTVARDGGLNADCEDTKFLREYMVQHNQTNLDYLRGIAGWLDYDLHIRHLEDPKKLRFHSPELEQEPALKVVYEKPNIPAGEMHLRRFDGRQSLSRVVSSVVVRGWNPAEKREIIGRADQGDLLGQMSGSGNALGLVQDKWGDTERQLVDFKVFSQEEADSIAKGKINEYARTFLSVDMEVQGSPVLYPGCIVEALRVGPKYDGPYFVSSVVHRFVSRVGQGHGFGTRFVADRCGW